MRDSNDPRAIALDLFLTASERDPRDEKYGIVTSDTSEGAEFRLAALWFNSRAELADYLTQSFSLMASDEAHAKALAAAARTVLDAGLDADSMKAINQCAVRGFSLQWAGSFAELCSAEGNVPRSIVSMFRDSNPEGRIRPVGELEFEAFVEFLADLTDQD